LGSTLRAIAKETVPVLEYPDPITLSVRLGSAGMIFCSAIDAMVDYINEQYRKLGGHTRQERTEIV
jgi:hypothetical protein